MMLTLAKKKRYRKYVVVLICLSIAGNLAHWKVMCYGADGHIELESALHERCNDPDHFSASDQTTLPSQAGHEICKHCGPCVDVPICIGLAKISRSTQQLNPIFLIPSANILIDFYKHNSSEYNLAANTFSDTSYFTPLQTVILLV